MTTYFCYQNKIKNVFKLSFFNNLSCTAHLIQPEHLRQQLTSAQSVTAVFL